AIGPTVRGWDVLYPSSCRLPVFLARRAVCFRETPFIAYRAQKKSPSSAGLNRPSAKHSVCQRAGRQRANQLQHADHARFMIAAKMGEQRVGELIVPWLPCEVPLTHAPKITLGKFLSPPPAPPVDRVPAHIE